MMNTNQDIKIAQYYFYPTMNCSLSCDHCFIEEAMRHDKTRMSVEQFKIVVDKYAEHFVNSNIQNAEMTIMGGEPTLVDAEFYQEVIPYIRRKFDFEKTGKYAFITLMTNFMHLSKLEKIADLFDFIATSYEPNRFDERKFKVWEQNIKDWVARGKRVVLSFTTTPDVMDKGVELFDYFYDIGVRNFQINNAVPGGSYLEHSMSKDDYAVYLSDKNAEHLKFSRKRKRYSISNNMHMGFQAESDYYVLITEWLLNKSKEDGGLRVDPIHGMIADLLHDQELGDIACGSGKGFSTRTDGLVTGCAAEIGNSTPLSFGNIFEDSIVDIENSPVRTQQLFANERLPKTCLACEFVDNCKGGCQQRSRLWDPKSGLECHGLKSFLSYIQSNNEKLKRISDER
ncbi:SPASM domain-containing protein [Vibrio parahaemolyticus]|uniref:radical SAM protein n=1 Tax=Vibrio TaxID=662 RepID=UPI0011942169|nr:SPASM domain-containing protein [Vibrio sp. 2092]MBE4779252.1 SPASM domain-containing protein [Vibrio parahaemolyticus]MCA2476033.1 SPASM domain-containing protein [Vibrio alginolyticus]TVN10173.1 SPASM domain-containing protein [Vibrio cholerae]MDG2756157.1 SPASM domain-containing protein [Vibrio parahaemolyticus]MDW2156064.1 SPASM domain-containing protein [Vibrio sp. 2092]